MKVARFSLDAGEPLYGVLDGDDLVVLPVIRSTTG